MITLASFTTSESPCGYLPDRTWQLHYDFVAEATAEDYEKRLQIGWRRFGRAWFRPRCPACTSCVPLRIDAAKFVPDRSQRRNRRFHEDSTELVIGTPEVSQAKLDLYDRFHEFQTHNVGWPGRGTKNAEEYYESFVDNPFPTEEWCYYREGMLIGVGYIDALPKSLSAIYYFHEPDLRPIGLGTWNVLSCIDQAVKRDLDFVYLGYFVDGCRSLQYKARFKPVAGMSWDDQRWAEIREPDQA